MSNGFTGANYTLHRWKLNGWAPLDVVSTFKTAEWCASRLPRSRGCRRIYQFQLSAKSSSLSRVVTCSPRSPNSDPQTDFYTRDKLGAANSLTELIHLYLEAERSEENSSWIQLIWTVTWAVRITFRPDESSCPSVFRRLWPQFLSVTFASYRNETGASAHFGFTPLMRLF